MTSKEKLNEIQEMARWFHDALCRDFEPEMFTEGGSLLLGKYYSESTYLYFGLNPGYAGEPPLGFDVELRAEYNPPFHNSDGDNRLFPYWRTWERFLSRHADLFHWFNDRVTSAFLVPWRTRKSSDLGELNAVTSGRLFAYAGELVNKMIEHHEATLLIVAGKCGLQLLNRILGNRWVLNELDNPREGPGGLYQWRRRLLPPENKTVVLQIPHFSRARSHAKLDAMAVWLREQLGPFGLISRAAP